MLNVMIVDDEPPARARLGQVLRDCSQQVSLQVIEAGGSRDAGDGPLPGYKESPRVDDWPAGLLSY